MSRNPHVDNHAVPNYGCLTVIGQLLSGEGLGIKLPSTVIKTQVKHKPD